MKTISNIDLQSKASTFTPEYELWVLMTQANHMIERARARELRKQGLTDMEFRALLAMSLMGDNATIGRIARWLGRTPHATSALLSRMEKSGLVRRVRDLDNKSKVRIYATDKGQSIYQRGKEAESIQRIMSSLPKSKARRDQLRSDMEIIREAAFKEFGMASKPPLPKAIISDKEETLENL